MYNLTFLSPLDVMNVQRTIIVLKQPLSIDLTAVMK